MNAKIGSLIVAGIAAYAYYKYTQMSKEEREELVTKLKEKGKKLYDEYMPGNVKESVEKNFM
ncbi:hypothetical protein BH11BAC6_BH11BAC6_08080 [soil metagenome]